MAEPATILVSSATVPLDRPADPATCTVDTSVHVPIRPAARSGVRDPDVSAFDALIARSVARLRAAGPPMPVAALDAVVLDVVLEAARLALSWVEE